MSATTRPFRCARAAALRKASFASSRSKRYPSRYKIAPAAMTSDEMSLNDNCVEIPRYVFMVRCASGVTAMMQRPVGTDESGPPLRKSTPICFISSANTAPNSSSATLPMNATSPPRLAMPASVLAPEPPLVRVLAPTAFDNCTARSVSIKAIEPFTMSWAPRKSSSTMAIMSTKALPTPTTS